MLLNPKFKNLDLKLYGIKSSNKIFMFSGIKLILFIRSGILTLNKKNNAKKIQDLLKKLRMK